MNYALMRDQISRIHQAAQSAAAQAVNQSRNSSNNV
jgi:hypothetical protein